ncbi:MAG: GTP 3',8-cyclase MoaA [Pseudomonadota bacterium]
MANSVFDINDLPMSPISATSMSREIPGEILTDTLGRPLQELRISVTDRCNFRCVYCMPRAVFNKNYVFLQNSSLLSFNEIIRVAKIFVAYGVRKIRLTGGEPLLRKHVERLIATLSELRTCHGEPLDLTLTTNGSLLAQKAQALKDAGLQRITVSLDALDERISASMNDVGFKVRDVLAGIDEARRVGLSPIKINMVVKRGMNDLEILPMARFFKESPFILRFIEYMDVGASNGWKLDEVVPSDEVVRRIHAEMPLVAAQPNYNGETAERWRYKDGGGEIGLISSVTRAFCQNCSRARLSTEGKLFSCLFATSGYDLRRILRAGGSDEEISSAVVHLWRARTDRYSELRTANTGGLAPQINRVEMSYIGG